MTKITKNQSKQGAGVDMRFFIDFFLVLHRFWLHIGSKNNQKTDPEPNQKHIAKSIIKFLEDGIAGGAPR